MVGIGTEKDMQLDQNNRREAAPHPLRARTFLKCIVYYDNRRASIEGIVRDLSDTGARIVFTTLVTMPDNVEVYIPQKQVTWPAQVRRRDGHEIGVSFQDQYSDEPCRAVEAEWAERVVKIENELVAMKRLLKKIEAKILPNDGEL